jgi:ABC-2 type transport system ATP-binding protein
MPVLADHIPSQTDALRVEDVSHSFGSHVVLDNVSLHVPRGKFAVLLGLNGAGKSTLFALVTRLYDNITGEIKILGFDVRRRPTEALQRLGVCFQSRAIDPDLSLTQNLLYHAALHGIGGKDARARAQAALEKVEMSDRAGSKVRTLSGGLKSRAPCCTGRDCCCLMSLPSASISDRARA